MVETLESATQVPLGKDRSPYGTQLINIFHRAGLEMRARVSFFRGVVPVAVVMPVPRFADPGVFPAKLSCDLTEAETSAVEKLKAEIASLSADDVEAVKNFSQASEPVEWELGELILGRAAAYSDLLVEFKIEGEITNLRSFTLNCYGTVFGAAGVTLKAAGVESAWANAIVSCGATLVSVASVAAIPTGFGAAVFVAAGFSQLVNLAGLASSAYDCLTYLPQVAGDIWTTAMPIYEEMTVIETYSTDRPGDNYKEGPNREYLVYQGKVEVNSIKGDDLKQSVGSIKEAKTREIGDWKRNSNKEKHIVEFDRYFPEDRDDDAKHNACYKEFEYVEVEPGKLL
jgi:hypothetical protein